VRRREFITLLGGAAGAWPTATRAQQTQRAMPVVGFLNSESSALYGHRAESFRKGLVEAGFVEGRNVMVEYRWADSQYERIPALVADLIKRQVSVLTVNGPSVYAAKAATKTIPIVFFTGTDPVAAGLVASLNKPGGNLTGATVLNIELTGKRLEILREVIPMAASFALLVNPKNANAKSLRDQMLSAARAFQVQVHVLEASNEVELDVVFTSLKPMQVGGLVIGADGFFSSHSKHLAALAGRYAIPAIFEYREFIEAGGMISYGGNLSEAYKQIGMYTGRVLKGERPADLPIVQSAKVELLVNLKTAKALGLTVPPTLLARADEVIE
jgi:putative ABC transport system substrate-binding protein